MFSIKNFKSLIIFQVFIISVMLSHVSYAQPQDNFNKKIQTIIDQDCKKYQIVGAQISISFPNESVPRDFVSGRTTLNGAIPINSSTLFQIGSTTKSFIATILLQMEAEKLLSLDDPISKWLPQIPSSWKNISIKQLLNHTSGIPNYMDSDKFYSIEMNDFTKQWAPEELINLIVDEPLYFTPGQGFHYSNTNYILAGSIIQAASGMSIDEAIETKLLEPLQLSNTYYLPYAYDQATMQKIAHGYSETGLFPDEPKDVTDFNMSMAGAAGAMLSTSHDLAIWFRNLLTGSVLAPAQLEELKSLVDETNGQPISIKNRDQGYGLGVEHYIDPTAGVTWFHTGETVGYSTWMIWLKRNDIVITILVNDEKVNMSDNTILVNDLISYIENSNKYYGIDL